MFHMAQSSFPEILLKKLSLVSKLYLFEARGCWMFFHKNWPWSTHCQHHCSYWDAGVRRTSAYCRGQITKQEEDKSVWPQTHPIWIYSSTLERQGIAGEAFALCEQERQRLRLWAWNDVPVWHLVSPKTMFYAAAVLCSCMGFSLRPWCALPSLVCASEMGRLDNHETHNP